jgi:hypothetical protein
MGSPRCQIRQNAVARPHGRFLRILQSSSEAQCRVPPFPRHREASAGAFPSVVQGSVENRVNPPEAQDEIDLDSIVLRKRSSTLHSGSLARGRAIDDSNNIETLIIEFVRNAFIRRLYYWPPSVSPRRGVSVGMIVEDVYWQHRRLWVRLHEKGGKEHAMPCHHNLETYLQDYIEAAGLADDREGALFRTSYRRTGVLTERAMTQSDGWRMLQRGARDAGIPMAVCNHTFRATGITAYLDNGGSLENAQAMAAHESPRTTKLYDRTDDQITLDEVEKIGI